MFCKYEIDVFWTHVSDIVIDLSMYEMLVLEFSLCSLMNKLSKTNRALSVFQSDIHGGSAPVPLLGGALHHIKFTSPYRLQPNNYTYILNSLKCAKNL